MDRFKSKGTRFITEDLLPNLEEAPSDEENSKHFDSEATMDGLEQGISEAVRSDSDLHKLSFVAQQLLEKAALFNERNKIYGDNYFRFGPIMVLLLGNQKLDTTNQLDMARLGVLVQLVAKLTRYCENFNRGGHPDSLDDTSVYAMMLKQIDQEGLQTS